MFNFQEEADEIHVRTPHQYYILLNADIPREGVPLLIELNPTESDYTTSV